MSIDDSSEFKPPESGVRPLAQHVRRIFRDGGGEGSDPATVRTTCPYCGVGCGVLATPDGKGGAVIKGDPAASRPTPAGCAPRARRWARRWGWKRACCTRSSTARSSWDQALDHVATRLAAIRAAHGPEAIAFYLSGQLLTEDYYVANKLAKGLHRHAARRHQLAPVHGVVGGGPSPCLRRRRGAAVLRRPRAGRSRRAGRLQRRLVPPDPLSAHPDGAGRARRAGRQHRSAPHRHLRGRRPAALHQARHRRHPVVRAAGVAGRAQADRAAVHRGAHARLLLGAAARRAARAQSRCRRRRDRPRPAGDRRCSTAGSPATSRVVSCYSQGVNQSAQGTDKVNAIINCHLATGRIGKPGSGPLSLTGQPNAMGGREVGGLANMLAAHMGFSRGRARPRAPLLECAQSGDAAKASKPSTCSMRSPTAASRRCG